MRKDLLARAFFGVMIVALGGILLLQNLDIIKFNNWGIFWGIFWDLLLFWLVYLLYSASVHFGFGEFY